MKSLISAIAALGFVAAAAPLAVAQGPTAGDQITQGTGGEIAATPKKKKKSNGGGSGMGSG
jgi:hypothetical protein